MAPYNHHALAPSGILLPIEKEGNQYRADNQALFPAPKLLLQGQTEGAYYSVQSILRGSLHVFLTRVFNPAKLPNGLPHG